VRSGGFYVVSISGLYIGLQILYVIMMYISVYPVVITMRHSNVYEERSLGIYEDQEEGPGDLEDTAGTGRGPGLSAASTLASAGGGPTTTTTHHGAPLARTLSNTRSAAATALGRALYRTFTWQGVGVQQPSHHHGQDITGPGGLGSGHHETRISFISQQVHGQLAHDIWWLVLAVLVISTIETSHFLADPVDYSVFNVIFEVVSGYGTVGISVGVPWAAYSFSGGWHGASKLVLCAVMLRGRHRGLPVALDRAVRLPGEQLHREEEEDWRIRRSMTSRRVSLEA
jgi:Trk-type K+ transport system membrane component